MSGSGIGLGMTEPECDTALLGLTSTLFPINYCNWESEEGMADEI